MNLEKNKRIILWLGAVIFLPVFLLVSQPAQSGQFGPYASPQEYGWSVYYKYHKAKRHPEAYPFPGPVIKSGEDIPVCDAARKPEAYLYKTDVRYIFHGKDGYLFRTADFRMDFTATPATIDYFQRLNRALASKGQTLIIAFQPPRALMEAAHLDPSSMPQGYDPASARLGYETFLGQLRNAGLIAVDISRPPPGTEYFPHGDFHWSRVGARYAAQAVAETVKKLNGYESIKKQDFINRVSGQAKIPTRGAFENFIQNTCKINIEEINGDVWEAQAQESADKGASLLGEIYNPEIAVVGTSNSAEDDKFNFIGSLKEFLHADIYNAAIVAGGFGSPGLRYYSSDEYKNAPPKFIIWEFLPQHQYNSEESAASFRQMIPAIYGACDAKKALASYSGEIKDAQTDLFPDFKNKTLKNAYLYMEIKNPSERNLKVNILYGDGNADQPDLTRSTRAANNGEYFLDLSNVVERQVAFFHITTDKMQGHINARLCQYPVNLASRS